MASAPELSAVVARPAAMRLLDEHALVRGCRVAVYGPDGLALRSGRGFEGARPAGCNGSLHVEGAAGPLSAAEVVAFERLLGYVLARPGSAAASDEDAHAVAAHCAELLAELGAREYELNDLSREILGTYEELNLFYDLSGELAEASDAEAICGVALAKARRVIAARFARILLADGPHGGLRVVVASETGAQGAVLARGAGMAGRVFDTGVAEPVDDVRQLPPGSLADLETTAQRSLITVALTVPGRSDRPPVGVLQMFDKVAGGDGAESAAFTSGDLKLAQAIASQAAVLIQNSRLIGLERELRIARTIQQSLLPGAPPDVAGVELAGVCVPASNVGGDYYDHLLAGPDRVAFLVADVSGHNLAAALLQTAARAAFRAAAASDASPSTVMIRASRTLHDDLSRAELFLTAWLGVVDAGTGVLRYSDAGHNPALHYRAITGDVVTLSTGGVPIGVLADGPFDEGTVELAPGDVVLVYTDGVTEAGPPGDPDRQYGEDRLAVALRRAAGLPAAEIVRTIVEDVARHCGDLPAGDDRSLVVLRWRGRPADASAFK